MSGDLTLLAALTAVAVSLLALWSNPKRTINRVFVSLSVHAALWLICLGRAIEGGGGAQSWMRITTAIGAFIPLHLWIIKETIAASGDSLSAILIRSRKWALACLVLSGITFTQWFVPTQIGAEIPRFGGGYYAYVLGAGIIYLLLCYQTIRQIRSTSGVSRIELQIVLLGGSSAALAVIILMAFRTLFDARWLMTVRPLLVLMFYAGTVLAITTKHILDARQVFAIFVQKISLITLVALVAYIANYALASLSIPAAIAILLTTAIALWFAASVNSWLDRMFRFYPEGASARQAALTAAQCETRIENLEKAFCSILMGWGQTDHVLLLAGQTGVLKGGGVELDGDSVVVTVMRSLRWATPERLMRERPSELSRALYQFLSDRRLGALVLEQGPALTVLVGIGVAASRKPFTYPHVRQLFELASIMESALERAHFSAKVQHTEQLATVGLLGASLAHEIRNPLVSIKTFVQLLPTHHHDAAFRDKFFRLMSDEVARIDRMTEQLLDLASPRAYAAETINLHPVLLASLDLIAAKALNRSVRFITDFGARPDVVFTDASAAKQVMLNLCFNAIQALEIRNGHEAWVKISTRNTARGIEMAVSDNGPGVSDEIRQRLFQPFQTTKSTGFGLGLAICSDILANVQASISVDPAVPGAGATFRVTFPCQPSSS